MVLFSPAVVVVVVFFLSVNHDYPPSAGKTPEIDIAWFQRKKSKNGYAAQRKDTNPFTIVFSLVKKLTQ